MHVCTTYYIVYNCTQMAQVRHSPSGGKLLYAQYARHTTPYAGGYELTQNDASCTQNRLKLAAASSRKMYKLEAKCSKLYHFESTFACIWSSIVGSHFLNNFVKVRKTYFFSTYSCIQISHAQLNLNIHYLEIIVKCHISNHSISNVIKHLILNISCSIL